MDSTTFTNALADAVGNGPATAGGRRFVVAFSGGLDSTVLLHLCAGLRDRGLADTVRAVHVDHGLHIDSPSWARHCADVAAGLGVPCRCAATGVISATGVGLESAARTARYRVLADALTPGEYLLTAHHCDDQLETVLLALLRGAGPRGLAGMPRRARFGTGWHLRPLLGNPRRDIEAYGRSEGLRWLEDPANDSPRFDRNYLRRTVTPALGARWPAASANALVSAALCAEADGLSDELAGADLAALGGAGPLPVDRLAAMSDARIRNVLRAWLRRHGLSAPPRRRLASIVTDLVCRPPGGTGGCVAWPGGQVRRYRNRIHAIASLPEPPCGRRRLVAGPEGTPLPDGLGRLRLRAAVGGGIREDIVATGGLELGFRQGGETLRPAGQDHDRSLKRLLQEAGVVPWMRARMPLIFLGDTLIGVAGLWLDHSVVADAAAPGWQPVWQDHPAIH